MCRRSQEVYVLFLCTDFFLKYCLLGLVVEDAPSGLRAGRAAGSLTLAVCTSVPRATIVESGADPSYIVSDLTKYVFLSILSIFLCTLTIHKGPNQRC